MAVPGPAGLSRVVALFAAFLAHGLVSAANDDGATTSPQKVQPKWLGDDKLELTLPSMSSQQYPVLPLTPNVGMNESDNFRRAIAINGIILPVDSSNYNEVKDPDQVPFLCCDDNENDSNITPDLMLNYLMGVKPRAILLYSKSSDTSWCSFDRGNGPGYGSILSMADSGDSRWIYKYLTSNSTKGSTMMSINGKSSSNSEDTSKSSSGNSTVAMSVLYSVTGLITLLFLIIIATGTIRAHRHPERYGPRGGMGGRGRQSRAKGLARAVLDTIPIVKFSNNDSTKPDPEVELESQRAGRQGEAQNSTTDGQADQADQTTPEASGAIGSSDAVEEPAASAEQADAGSSHEGSQKEPVNTGCSICTEDFTVGEDVRLLPCQHQFHPSCIDPWLVNVSGTCPLCRLNLQPGKEGQTSQDLPPPLPMDQDDAGGPSHYRQNRLSRLLDGGRFRQMPREEQIAALRQMRAGTTETQTSSTPNTNAEAPAGAAATETVVFDVNAEADGEERTRRARFAAKLKERFRIRTTAQS